MDTDSPTRSFEVFTSYSHSDSRFIKPLVQLLRPVANGVFRDEDSIPPGTKWVVVIATAIEGCRLMYLFWCSHSSSSAEVQKEYEKAIRLQKNIVPVLLDDTPLPASLSEFQWIDLRNVLENHEASVTQTISLEEGQARQRLSDEGHGVPEGTNAYSGGDFARQGWVQHGNEYVRQVLVEKEPSDTSMRLAAAVISADLERRMSSGISSCLD